MATRTRDSGAPVKEKRGTSPSPLPHTGTSQRRSTPNSSKTNSPARSQDSTASEKHIPNYLKPTVSSGLDVSKQQAKRPVSTTDSAHKPTLTRRRSFDKPPSPSPTQKTRISPNPTLRSSSFSGKTIPSQKGVLDKMKASKDAAGKHHNLYARPIKKTSIYVKKQDIGNSTSTTKEQVVVPPGKVDNPNVADVPEPEMQPEDQESSIAEAEEQTAELGSKNEKGSKDIVLEDQEPINVEQTEVETDKDAKIVIVDSSTVSEHQDAYLGVKTEEPEEKSHVEEIISKQQEINDHTVINGVNKINTDESVAGNPAEEVEEKETEEEEEAIALSKKEEAANEIEANESKETEEVQEVAVEEKQEAENAAPKTQVAQAKRDSAVSNDVIEETASKLREQRKNKVKALAGAFETVISLQEPK